MHAQRAQELIQTTTEEISGQEAQLASKWDSLLSLNLAHDLQEQLQQQRQACGAMHRVQADAQARVSCMLSQKDEEFVATLKLQSAEQDGLLLYFHQQKEQIQDACSHELKAVEMALQQVCVRV